MDAEIANAILDRIPNYNKYLLKTFSEEQVNNAANFIEVVFKQAVKLFAGYIEYDSMRIIPPEERAVLELEYRHGCSVANSELLLVEYRCIYNGTYFPILLYMPYFKNGVITIEDTKYVPQLSIKEKVYSKSNNGITIKVIRQPVHFYRSTTFRYESLTDDWFWNGSVPTTTIYNSPSAKGSKSGKNKRFLDTTIIQYLLCKFGLTQTIVRFGLKPEDVTFTDIMGGDIDEYRYFAAKKYKNQKTIDLFLKVKKSVLDDPIIAKLIGSILYPLMVFQKHQLEHFTDPHGTIYRIILGKSLYGKACPDIQCKSKVDAHIPSVDTYLDEHTKNRLWNYDIKVNDIYDLMQYVFVEIDKIYVNTAHTDLYNTRIDVIEELLVQPIVHMIYKRWYRVDRNLKKLNDRDVTAILNFKRDAIRDIYKSNSIQKNPPAYGDNILVGWKILKTRQSANSKSGIVINSPDHIFHPSMAVVETLIAFSKSSPGAGGSINPHLQITPDGSVIRPDYADEIDVLKEVL